MKKLIKLTKLLALLAVVCSLGIWLSPGLRAKIGLTADDSAMIERAYADHISNIVVETDAVVTLIKPDLEDLERSQVFVVTLDNGHRVEVMHNLDVAQGVPVRRGAKIRVRGEYDWTPQGGVIHWTHNDPTGQREGGWIEYEGKRYF